MTDTQLFQSKSLLAKLLAQENIEVVHRKVSTAYFDLNSRVIVLPFWKDMDDPILYDLLMGHEVGHALDTPKEGWHDAIVENKALKTYLNVIEDARIERRMKNRYPGLRRSFNLAYKKLHDKNFFAIKDKDVSKMLFIDRINVFYKLGSFINVPFTSEELKIIDRINAAETWAEVEAIAREIYSKALEEKKNNPTQDLEEEDYQDSQSSDENNDDDDNYDQEDLEYDQSYEDSDDEDIEDVEDRGNNAPTNESDEEQEEQEPEEDQANEIDTSSQKKESSPDVSSETDQAFRSNEKNLVDDSSGNVHVLNVPQYNNSNVFDWKAVHAAINAHREYLNNHNNISAYVIYRDQIISFMSKKVNLYRDLMARTSPTVNYMVKEFEMRKNASQLSRAKVGKSGKVNPKKLSRYNLDNDIFQRITTVPQGKNHGLILFIDLSGSMSDIMKKTFEQAVMLTMFCKKVNIPFEVYGFSDSPKNPSYDKNKYPHSNNTDYYKPKAMDLLVHDPSFHMKQYLSSSMSSSAYRQAVENILWVGSMHGSCLHEYLPPTEHLHGTPLDEAIISSINLVNAFKTNHRLDLVNSIFLTDGLGGISTNFIDSHMKHNYVPYKDTLYIQYPGFKDRVKYKDMTKDQGSRRCANPDPFISTRALIEIARAVTGAKYTGYYISDRKSITYQIMPYLYPRISREVDAANHSVVRKEITKNGFYSADMFGFDEYFFVLNENLQVDEKPVIDVEDNAKKGQIAKAFMKSLNKRGLQRLFLNKFVQNIAA